MFENLKKYVSDEDYLISFMEGFVHCYNYKVIKKITDSEVIIKFLKVTLYLKGKELILKTLDKDELLIGGLVTNIELR